MYAKMMIIITVLFSNLIAHVQCNQQHQVTSSSSMPAAFKEIEIKIQITHVQLEALKIWLATHAKLIHELSHTEWYLDNPSDTFFFVAPEGYKDALNYLRVRHTPNGDSIAYKKWYKDPVTGKTTHCDEYETSVANGPMMLALLAQLGFTTQTKIAKKRQTYQTSDFEITLDDAKDIGYFVEIEVRNPKERIQDSLNDIYNFLRSINITTFTKQDRGYVNMAWNPEYDFGELIVLPDIS